MNRWPTGRTCCRLTLAVLICAAGGAGRATAQVPGTVPAAATQPAVPAPPLPGVGAPPVPPPPGQGRSREEIAGDLAKLNEEMFATQPAMDALFDPAKRAEAAPKALPAMRRRLPLLDELAAVAPEWQAAVAGEKLDLLALMAMLGDEPALQELKKLTLSPSRDESVAAQAWVMAVNWSRTVKDAPAQQALAREFTALARQNVDNPVLTQVASLMTEQAATPALIEEVEDVVLNTLGGPAAGDFGRAIQARRKLRAIEGKPLVVDGNTVDGIPVSTGKWKGKVVLVDFWTTQNPQCMAELPRLKKLYAENHANGLEILGVSSDRDAGNFRAFLADNKDMPWPQLFDHAGAGAHPLVMKYGIPDLPARFVIDRKGVVRSVSAAANYPELVAKLLAEKAD